MCYTVGVVGVVEVEDAEATGVDEADVIVADALASAPILCCSSSAILIVVLSIADFGK